MLKKILVLMVVLAAITPVYAGNLLGNPGFESGALDGGWSSTLSGTGASAGVNNADKRTGTYSAYLKTDGVTWGDYIQQTVAMTPGSPVTVGVSYRSPAGSWASFGLNVIYQDASHNQLTEVNESNVVTHWYYAWVPVFSGSGGDDTGWVDFTASTGEGDWVAPEGTVYAKFIISQWGWQGDSNRYDDAILTPEPTTMVMLTLGGLALIRRKKA